MPGKRTEILFTKEDLKKYSETGNGLYLAILGKVYDVGKGENSMDLEEVTISSQHRNCIVFMSGPSFTIKSTSTKGN